MASERNYYSTGRGGAGNLQTTKPIEETTGELSEIPEISQKVFTTGRGGAGNMVNYSDAETSRKIQDAESPSLLPISSPSIGRGGYGNVRAGQEASNSLLSRAKRVFKRVGSFGTLSDAKVKPDAQVK